MSALGMATAAFGMWRLGHTGLWPDEAFSVHASEVDFSTLVRLVTTDDSSNALYYSLLHFWQQWGSGEVWLRLPSVMFGIGTVVTLFALNRQLFGLSVAVTSGALLAFNLFFIRYMQEARVYALATFLVVMTSYCFVLALERPSPRRWIVYGVVGAIAIYAHIFSGFVVASHLISLVFLRGGRPPFRFVGGAALLIGALVSPLGALMIATKQLARPFIPTPSADSFESLFLYLTGGAGVASRGTHLLLFAYFLACCVAVTMMVRTTFGDRERNTSLRWSYTLMLCWLAVPVLTSFAISFARPIFYPRYLIIVLPALVTIAGIGISVLPRLTLRALSVGAVLALAISPLLSYYSTSVREGGDWRGAAEYVVQHKQPGDGVVFLSRYGRGVIEYYLDRFHGEHGLVPVYPQEPWGAYVPVLGDRSTEPTTTAAQRLHSGKRIWVLLLWGGFDSRAEDGAPIKAALNDAFTQVAGQRFGPSLEARLYQRKAK